MNDDRPNVAVFRPDDGRLGAAVDLLESMGVAAVGDPMLEVEPTGEAPREDADYAILTSPTAADLVADADWNPGDTTVCAIGESTADALREVGYAVDLVPEEYSSSGLVATLDGDVDGARVEVARSDHGSAVLLDGLEDAGAYLHETVLYRLVRPPGSGQSVELAAQGDLDGALFTSSLTVEHFLDAADQRGVRDAAVAELNDAVVGAIGTPTAETAAEHGIEADVIPETADVEALARAVVERIESR
ncbi:MAG TPA: uroporphyrinogen-III synthase [Natrialbaceae archaeon]|nr:uroporphyrinogen-III synthase [Natrialbaceae archaeon]